MSRRPTSRLSKGHCAYSDRPVDLGLPCHWKPERHCTGCGCADYVPPIVAADAQKAAAA